MDWQIMGEASNREWRLLGSEQGCHGGLDTCRLLQCRTAVLNPPSFAVHPPLLSPPPKPGFLLTGESRHAISKRCTLTSLLSISVARFITCTRRRNFCADDAGGTAWN